MSILVSAALAFGVGLFATGWLVHFSAQKWLDQPNHRSLHGQPIARSGGIGILLGSLSGAVLLLITQGALLSLGMWLALMAIAALGLTDDLHSLSARQRLLAQLAAALLVMVTAPWPLWQQMLGWLWWPLALLALVWMLNLYNFMDGLDGLAGGMALIGLSALALFGYWAGDYLYCAWALIVAAAAGGFLYWNFAPAKIFMGDGGSTFLGFYVGLLLLLGVERQVFSLWAGLLIFLPFWLDASYTLLKRLWRGEKIWQAHRQHFYQRLALLGWSHKRVALSEYLLMFFCVIVAIPLRDIPHTTPVSVGLLGLFVIIPLLMVAERWLQRRLSAFEM